MSFLGAAPRQARNVFGNLSVAQRNTLTDPFGSFGTAASPGLADIFGRLPVAQQQPLLSGFGDRSAELPFMQPITAGDVAGSLLPQGVEDGGFTPITAGDIDARYRTAFSPAQQGFGPQQQMGTGQMASLGGDWSGVDQWNSQIQAAASRHNVPANLIKAIMKLESGGNPGATGAPGVVGLMQINTRPDVWGSGPWNYDNAANIDKGAEILAGNFRQHGSWDMAVQAYLGFGTDMFGTTNTSYRDRVFADWNALNSAGGSMGGGLPSMVGNQAFINGLTGGNAVGNSIVQQAMQYVGVPYVWGGIPGRGDNPWDSGWDCSGMTYWLDQTYGGGRLPMGSHYQYQYAQQTGQLFTNLSQLQPGDLVFINTGWQGGAGANLNAAGHVGMYIGNGQMLHAANPSTGTIVSPLSGYGGILGAMHMSFSGGAAGVPGMGGGMPQQPMGGGYGMSPQQRLIAMLRGGF